MSNREVPAQQSMRALLQKIAVSINFLRLCFKDGIILLKANIETKLAEAFKASIKLLDIPRAFIRGVSPIEKK